jgi:hypothetical protein
MPAPGLPGGAAAIALSGAQAAAAEAPAGLVLHRRVSASSVRMAAADTSIIWMYFEKNEEIRKNHLTIWM